MHMKQNNVTITYNHQSITLNQGTTLTDLLQTNVEKTDNCIIFVNDELVSHELYDSYELQNWDVVVKVHFMPGG
jgi:thiamine biosynthesis protein ThiS